MRAVGVASSIDDRARCPVDDPPGAVRRWLGSAIVTDEWDDAQDKSGRNLPDRPGCPGRMRWCKFRIRIKPVS